MKRGKAAAAREAEITGKPEQHAVNYAVLRSLQRAIYSPSEEGHYALASECYCRRFETVRLIR